MGSCHLTLFKLFVFVVFFISYLLLILFYRFIFVLVYPSIHIVTIYFLMRRAFSVPLCSI